MKKQFTIHVDIDTEKLEAPGEYNSTHYEGDEVFIKIRKILLEGAVGDPVNSLAHELGHVVSTYLEMPKTQKFLRELNPLYALFGAPPQMQVPMEEEAWEVAEKIRFKEEAEKSINTYRRATL